MTGRAAYPAYRNSGIEWVGEVPDNWDVKPLFACTDTQCVKNDDGKEANVLSLSYGRIVRRDVDQNFGLLPESFNTYQLIGAGDIVLRLTDLQNDKRSLRVGHALESGIITSAYLKLTARKGRYLDRYLYLLLHSYDTTKVFYGMGGGLRQSMKFDDMRRLPMLVPSLAEQEQIANFLDHETAKIDTLIDKQQQLIKLLKEKRQAVISHAVTKGLNPAAPMKDSGVEWLGEVPEHWVMPKIGYLCEVTKLTGFEYTNCWETSDEGEIVALRGFNVGERFLNLEKTEKISNQLSNRLLRSKLKAGDIVMPCTGTLGNAAVIECNDKFHMNQNIAKLSFSEKVNPHFAVLWLTSTSFRTIVDFNNTSGMQPVLLIGDIRNMPIPLPSLQEQGEIIKLLDSSNVKFGHIIQRAERSLNLLQERRTALISAAVTGKIDVRNWQPTHTATPMEASA